MIVSDEHRKNSAIRIHVPILPQTPLPSRLAHNIEYSPISTVLYTLGLPGGSAGKESACNAGGLGSIPGLRRSPGEGNGYRLQYSGPENSMDWGCKSGTQLSNFYFHTVSPCQLPILNIAVCNVSIPDSLTIPPPILPPVTTSLFSKGSLYIPLPFYFFPFPYNYFKPGMYCSPPCFTMYTQFSLI